MRRSRPQSAFVFFVGVAVICPRLDPKRRANLLDLRALVERQRLHRIHHHGVSAWVGFQRVQHGNGERQRLAARRWRFQDDVRAAQRLADGVELVAVRHPHANAVERGANGRMQRRGPGARASRTDALDLAGPHLVVGAQSVELFEPFQKIRYVNRHFSPSYDSILAARPLAAPTGASTSIYPPPSMRSPS